MFKVVSNMGPVTALSAKRQFTNYLCTVVKPDIYVSTLVQLAAIL